MYANASASQSFSSLRGAVGKLPIQLPTSSIRPSTPLGVTMKRIPTTANVSASRRNVSTTSRSARPALTAGILCDRPTPGSLFHLRTIAGRMIDRDQVLHVARLARLKLTDDEVERMSSELSAVLDHIENISQLDLDGVEPTSHVVELENVLRPDEPRPSWPREKILEAAPDASDEGFSVPSPGG